MNAAPDIADQEPVLRALRERMRELGMSTAELARRTGLSETTIRGIGQPGKTNGVARRLRADIEAGTLRHHDMVRAASLSAQYGVSGPVACAALRMLAAASRRHSARSPNGIGH